VVAAAGPCLGRDICYNDEMRHKSHSFPVFGNSSSAEWLCGQDRCDRQAGRDWVISLPAALTRLHLDTTEQTQRLAGVSCAVVTIN
jgi:hypothetical protein